MKNYKLSDVLAARTNDKILKDCSPEVQRLFKECPYIERSYKFARNWEKDISGPPSEYFPSRISDNWPPDEEIEDDTVKAPEGYRIVSMEDRERCEYPEDCEVKWAFYDRLLWYHSENTLGWDVSDTNKYLFAVPTYYVFAEDRKDGQWFFNVIEKRASKKSEFTARDYSDFNYHDWIEITEKQRRYLQTKPEPEEGFDWALKVPENGDYYLSSYTGDVNEYQEGDTNGSNFLKGIRWVRVPVVKPAHNFTSTVTWHFNGEPFNEQILRNNIKMREISNKELAEKMARNNKANEEDEAILAAFEKAKGELK